MLSVKPSGRNFENGRRLMVGGGRGDDIAMFRPYELKQQRVVTTLIKSKNLLSKDYGYCEVKAYNSRNYDNISYLKFINE